MRVLLACAAALCFLVPASLGKPPAEVAKLIQQLGSDDFAEREAAHHKLESLGELAFDALRQAITESDDPEIKSRAQRILDAVATKGLRDETRALQGVWKLIHVGEAGAGVPVQGDDSLRLTIHGSQYGLKGSGFLGHVDTGGRCVLGRSPAGRTIDLHAPGRGPLLALYTIQGDTLRLCLDLTQEHHRPEKVAAGRSGWPMLLTLARVSR